MAGLLQFGKRGRWVGLILVVVVVGLVWGVWRHGAGSRVTRVKPVEINREDGKAFAAAQRAFAVNVYREAVTKQGGNLVFSPYSLASCLAMVSIGARGQTAAEIAEVLGVPVGAPWRDEAFQNAQYHLRQMGEDCVLVSANKVWVQRGAPIERSFLTSVKRHYGGAAQSVDFVDAPQKAQQKINDWIAQQTRGHLADMIGDGVIDHLTRLVLANAVYFKGIWQDEFEAYKTKALPFYPEVGKEVSRPTMQGGGYYRFGDFDDVRVLVLPYKGGHVSMTIFLPKEIDGLAAVEARLSGPTLAQWCNALKEYHVDLRLPKFELCSDLLVKTILHHLGMSQAFADDADFSGIADAQPPLFVSDVLHAGWIKVDEEGTEAAAATMSAIKAAGVPDDAPSFYVDHPFLFLICDERTGAILFMGRVIDPDM